MKRTDFAQIEKALAQRDPDKRDQTIWLTGHQCPPGFGVRISGDSISWVIKYRIRGDERAKQMKLGKYGALAPSAYRKAAQEVYRKAQAGLDPRPPRRVVGRTFDQAAADFVTGREAHRRNAYPSPVRSLVREWGKAPVDEITTADVILWFRKRSRVGLVIANREMKVLRLILDGEDREPNPARSRRIDLNKESKRTRVITEEERPRFKRTLDAWEDDEFRRLVQLLLVTMCRCGELLRLAWEDVGPDHIVLRDTKKGVDETIALDAPQMALLGDRWEDEGGLVFPSFYGRYHRLERRWRQFCTAAKLEGLNLHDLRRTAATDADEAAGLTTAQVNLRHGSQRTSEIYVNRQSKHTRRLVLEQQARAMGTWVTTPDELAQKRKES